MTTQSFSRAVELLHAARNSRIDILLQEDQLQLKMPENVSVDEGLLEEIRNNRELLIHFLHNNKLNGATPENGSDPIVPAARNAGGPIPLSFAQERLWFIDKLQGSIQYHLYWVFRLKGNLDEKALEESFREIADRHEVLRTVICEHEGLAFQQVLPAGKWSMIRVAGAFLTEAGTDLATCIRRLVMQPFNLADDKKLRVSLIDLSPDERILVVVIHHIACDGWSVQIIVRELLALYNGKVSGKTPLLEHVPVQYGDYAMWQRAYLQSDAMADHLAYWKRQLSNVQPLMLPADFIHPQQQSIRGATVSRVLGKRVRDEMVRLSRQEGVTLFMTLLTAFQVLLHRYSGQSDICVGTPVSGRIRQELENLVGFFVNTLALRSEVSGHHSFRQLLQQVKQTVLEAFEHQDVPFEKVVGVLDVARDLSRNPVFQVMFVLQNVPEPAELRLGDAELVQEHVEQATTQFDLTLTVGESPEGLFLHAVYCSDLFRESTIRRMLDHFENLLQAIAAGADLPVGRLPMLSTGEKEMLLRQFNDTRIDYHPFKNIVDMLSEQVRCRPHKTAVLFEDHHITYAALDARANQLAHFLIRKGVQRGSLVPVCLERSVEMIVSILAILKAGAAYVPVDPAYPRDRMLFIYSDTNARFVLTSSHCSSALPTTMKVTWYSVDLLWPEIRLEPVTPPQTGLQPQDLAYIIYTSGSTGNPKGVMMEHEGVVNRLLWAQDYFGLTEEDAVLQKTTFCFDVSVWELLWPLCAGAKLVFARPGGHMDAAYMKQLITRDAITTIHFVPPMLEVFLASVEPSDCRPLRRVLCSGEALKPAQVKLFREKLPHVGLHNLYGPTEAAIDVSYWTAPSDAAADTVPIGKPVANTSLYIVDRTGDVAPIGIPGELCIGGIQLARGYLNRPELTSERFVANHLTGEGRLYRTGDLARWLPDGNIEYLGRNDDQVKIRGYRIELGEIENVLSRCPLVTQAAVTVDSDPYGNKRILGYVVPNGAFNRDAINLYLREKLPEYMIPAFLLQLNFMPVSSNGKTDRKRLPAVDITEMMKKEYVPPRNKLEHIIANIWMETLGLDKIGVYDNFFEMGGNSISMFKLLNRLNKLGYAVQLKDLYVFQTVETQAEMVINNLSHNKAGNAVNVPQAAAATKKSRRNKHLLLLRQGKITPPLFIVPGAGGMGDGFQQFANDFGDLFTIYAIQMMGTMPGEKPYRTIRQMAAAHNRWIRNVQPEGPYRLIGHSFGGHVAFEMARQLEEAGQEVEFTAILDVWAELKGKTLTDDNKLDFVMGMAADYYRDFNVIREPYPEWVTDLRNEVARLPVDDMVPFIIDFLKQKLGHKHKNIELVGRLVNLRVYNAQMSYKPSAKLKGELIIFKSVIWKANADKTMGWAPHAENIQTGILPGNHSMVNTINTTIVANYLKNRMLLAANQLL